MLRRLLPKFDVTETSQCIITFPVALAGHKLVLAITVKASSVHEQTPKLHFFSLFFFKATKKIQFRSSGNNYTSNKGTMKNSH